MSALLAISMALVPLSPAIAAWSTVGTGGAAGSSTVMPNGSEPSGIAVGDAVTVSWSPATLPDGVSVSGYVITRYSAVTGLVSTVGSGCAGIVTTTMCTEDSVPAGTWVYSDTPVQNSWTGGQSVSSTPVVVKPT